MSEIQTSFGAGGVGLQPRHGDPDLATALRDIADDLAELRTQFIALLAKLDDDGGVTDENYEELLTPAALVTTKG